MARPEENLRHHFVRDFINHKSFLFHPVSVACVDHGSVHSVPQHEACGGFPPQIFCRMVPADQRDRVLADDGGARFTPVDLGNVFKEDLGPVAFGC